jgi:hypothetical protein
MKSRLCACLFGILLFAACNKKEAPPTGDGAVSAAVEEVAKVIRGVSYGPVITADHPLKAGETGLLLPAGSTIEVATDKSEVRVQLPEGYAFETAAPVAERTLPVLYATYHCICSGGGACQVAYDEGLGFGCFHGGCSGTCTGNFIYKGYSVNRIVRTAGMTDEFFSDPGIQQFIEANYSSGTHELFGVRFSIGKPSKPSCDCDGTKACVLKTKALSKVSLVYCAGPCNGCELTVD